MKNIYDLEVGEKILFWYEGLEKIVELEVLDVNETKLKKHINIENIANSFSTYKTSDVLKKPSVVLVDRKEHLCFLGTDPKGVYSLIKEYKNDGMIRKVPKK